MPSSNQLRGNPHGTPKNTVATAETMKFTDLPLDPLIMKGIEDAGFTDTLPVQEQTYQHAFAFRDVLVQSQTGSGKTAAFLISIFNNFLNPDFPHSRKALIIAPTRELADQIGKDAELLGRHLKFVTGVFFGGVGYHQQERLLERGVDIVIGTPGRLLDFNESRKIDFSQMGIVIIDEADRLFDMGFWPDLRRMIRRMPPPDKRQTMLFSATLDYDVRNLASEHMNDPAEVEIEPEHVTVDTIEQVVYHVGKAEKLNLLLGILTKETPKNAVIFTNTKRAAYEVSKRLSRNGFDCEFIMGDLPQSKRLKVIDDVKAGNIRFLVATDVAARGLHIDDLEMVVNYDLPEQSENYVHRIGRTARAGKSGKAVSLACEEFVYGLEPIEKLIGRKIEVKWAPDDYYIKDESAGTRYHLDRDRRDARDRDRRDRHDRGGRGRDDRKRRERQGGRPSTGPARRDERDRTEAPRRDASTADELQQSGAAAAATTDEARRRKRKRRRGPKEGAAAAAPVPQNRGTAPAQERPDSRRDEDRRGKKGEGHKHGERPSRKSKTEDRLEYYKQKYGEDFSAKGQAKPAKKKEKPTLFKKVIGIFKKKK